MKSERGVGRPRTLGRDAVKLSGLWVSRQLWEALVRAAARRGENGATVRREALEAHLKIKKP